MRERILTGALELFLQYGIKSITMDDIAAHLSVSKKTIYQHFKDKDEIVTLASKMYLEEEEALINQIQRESKNAVDEIFRISQHIRHMVANLNPSILFDIKKHHAGAWELYLQHRERCFLNTIQKNLEEGICEGYYHKDLDVEIIAILRMSEAELAWDPTIFPPTEYNISEVQVQFLMHFIRGLLTPKGYELWNKIYNNQ